MKSSQPHVEQPVSTLRVPNHAEIDFARLRRDRLARLQTAMRQNALTVCLFVHPPNIRYATGVDVMGVWTAGTIARYCLVPVEGEPILFEYELAQSASSERFGDVREARYWQFHGIRAQEKASAFADDIREAMRQLGASGEPLAVDRLDTVGFLALQAAGITVVDAGPATVDAREIKTPDEIALMKINGAIGDAMMAEFEKAIRPGIREHELFAVLSYVLLQHHGELVFSRAVASGRNTNPWGGSEAHDKMVMPGDLVGVDTDAMGYEGYVIDISRTFLCGRQPSSGQIEAYRIAHEMLIAMRELARPGVSYREFAQAVPMPPEKFRDQRYDSLVHGSGLEDESPLILFPDRDPNPFNLDREFQEGMVVNFECYIGELGAPFGVKLEDQALITENGAELLCTYPYDATLLGL